MARQCCRRRFKEKKVKIKIRVSVVSSTTGGAAVVATVDGVPIAYHYISPLPPHCLLSYFCAVRLSRPLKVKLGKSNGI